MSDLIERLRSEQRQPYGVCVEAADEIERLQSMLATYRDAMIEAQNYLTQTSRFNAEAAFAILIDASQELSSVAADVASIPA
jgi:uncharacterized protein (DUF934 family)